MDAAPAPVAISRARSPLARRAALLRWPALAATLLLAAVFPLFHDRSIELRIAGIPSAIISGGAIALGYTRPSAPPYDDGAKSRALGPLELRTTPWATLDGAAWRPYHYGTSRHHHLAVPVWLPLAAAAFTAGLAFGLAARRPTPWACDTCAYPLPRPTPGSPRTCPECGTRAP